MVKRLSTMWETQVQSLGQEDPPEKEIAIHSRTIAWKIPWTEEPGRLQSMGSQRVGHNWATSLSLSALYNRSYFVLKSSLKQMKQDAAEPNSWRDCPDSPPSGRSSLREASSGIYSDTHCFSLWLGWQLELEWKVTTYFLPNAYGESIRGVKGAKMWTPKGAEVRDDHNYREENSPE